MIYHYTFIARTEHTYTHPLENGQQMVVCAHKLHQLFCRTEGELEICISISLHPFRDALPITRYAGGIAIYEMQGIPFAVDRLIDIEIIGIFGRHTRWRSGVDHLDFYVRAEPLRDAHLPNNPRED